MSRAAERKGVVRGQQLGQRVGRHRSAEVARVREQRIVRTEHRFGDVLFDPVGELARERFPAIDV